MARTIFRRYFGPDEADWDRRFDDVFDGSAGLELVRFTPETVVVRDQSYRPTRWARGSRTGLTTSASGRGVEVHGRVHRVEPEPLAVSTSTPLDLFSATGSCEDTVQ